MRHVTLPIALTATCFLAACQSAPPAIPVEDRVPTPVQALQPAPPANAGLVRQQPEAASTTQAKPGWATRRFAVAAANPLATQAGYRVLKDGGSAVDAAIAVQMVLTLVEPQSSGIGGGAFLLHHDPAQPAAARRTEAYDGRETAPAAASDTLFLKADGQPMAFFDAVVGGRSVGTPGVVAMLALAHRDHGRLPWARLFEPAIVLARGGFPVSPRLYALLKADPYLRKDAVAAAYFYTPAGEPWPVGHLLKNPELAAVLQAIARQGPRALQRGEVASSMVRAVRDHATNPGTLSEADLAGYKPLKRTPLCTDHPTASQTVRLCGMPPPSSGAITIAQILGMLQHTPAPTLPLERGLPSADWLHLYTEAARLAFADRNQYLADPDFVPAPGGNVQSLLAPTYLAERARLIGPQSMKTAQPGVPGPLPQRLSAMPAQPEFGTSHISIVDAQGRVVAMTTTIESAFGARLMVNRGKGLAGGFLLNNELTDFSLAPTGADGLPVANRVQPGKRPRSSMSPTLVFERGPDGQTGPLLMSLGSPGGAAIIHYTAKTLVGMLHWGLDAQRAVDLPNFGSNNGPTQIEAGRFPADTVRALQARGHTVNEVDMTSGLQAIQKRPHGYFGGADPRREGVVMGD